MNVARELRAVRELLARKTTQQWYDKYQDQIERGSIDDDDIRDIVGEIRWDPRDLIRRMNLTLYFSVMGWEKSSSEWDGKFEAHPTSVPLKKFTDDFLKAATKAGLKKEWFGKRELNSAMDDILDELNDDDLSKLGINVAAKKIDIGVDEDLGGDFRGDVKVDEERLIEELNFDAKLNIEVKGNKVEISIWYDHPLDSLIPGAPENHYSELARRYGASSTRRRTAKVEYVGTPDGVRVTVIVGLGRGRMMVKDVDLIARGVYRKIAKAVTAIVNDLTAIPAVSNAKWDAIEPDEFVLGCSQSGPYLRAIVLVRFDYDGDRDMKWDILHQTIPSAFKRSGINAADKTEVVEEEEIEPQSSKPVKERRNRD